MKKRYSPPQARLHYIPTHLLQSVSMSETLAIDIKEATITESDTDAGTSLAGRDFGWEE